MRKTLPPLSLRRSALAVAAACSRALRPGENAVNFTPEKRSEPEVFRFPRGIFSLGKEAGQEKAIALLSSERKQPEKECAA